MDTERVPTHRLIAFAAPAFITSLMYGPLVGILPTIYAKYFGLALGGFAVAGFMYFDTYLLMGDKYPVIFLLITAITIWFFPIDERRQRVIRRRIESRSERAQREEAYLSKTTVESRESRVKSPRMLSI
ncbi:MAG: hypothetical protein JRH15_16615 [Deltaproteobacteria bacterium]|nr:hypothetical protein [Deltaproteobacteria bacterium]